MSFEKLRLLARLQDEDDATPSTTPEAALTGPLAVEEVEAKTGGLRYAVVRKDEPVAGGGKAAGFFRDRDEALRAAAVLPAVAATSATWDASPRSDARPSSATSTWPPT